jgi:translocation and assembly module TamB
LKRGAKIALWSGGSLVLVVLLALAAVSWILFTTPGARWVADLATSRFAPQVKYASIDGTIAGQLIVMDFRFEGDPTAAKIRIAKLTVNPTLRMLFSHVLRIDRATVEGLVVTLPTQPKPDDDEPLWVDPPLDVVVNDFALKDGRVIKNGETLVTVKQLGVAARWTHAAIVIDRLSLMPGDVAGELAVEGRVMPAGKTLRGVLDARWKNVVIPAAMAGRVIASEGAIHVDGTPAKYAAKGELDAGPPGDLTHVVLDVSGTDRDAELRTLNLQQRAGHFAVVGHVQFQPLTWNLKAEARDFDPGALFADWPGKVNLDLVTQGELAEKGPTGSVRIDTLAGTLRGRPIAGGGDMEFAAPDSVSGKLEISSGRSRVAVNGNSKGKQRIDATVALAIASLGDWAPDTSGSLTGNFRVRGVWPQLTVEGSATGKALALADARVAQLEVSATVDTPLDPEGKVHAVATHVAASGFEFARVTVDASGNQAQHRLALDADGQQLKTSLSLTGALDKTTWRAELSKLSIAVPNVPALTLRRPANISLAAEAYEISETCLVDQNQAALCVAAKAAPGGALDANYSFEHVPLALANAFAPDAMPGQLRGEVNGRGAVRHTTDGQWTGEAKVTSPEAQLVLTDEQTVGAAAGQHTWLLYRDLDVEAQLRGTGATATLTAALQNDGKLDANVHADNLMAEVPGIGGEIDASMPTLAPFAAFVPTIGSLDGSVTAKILLGGTIKAPEVTGTINAQKLQADLGELGIELRDGRVEAEAKQGGGFLLAGSVASGKGHIEFKGTMNERGVVDVKVLGQNFQAADIPAANVVLTPDLTLTGDPKLYLLRGEVTIPSASINLQKLPKQSPPGVSPDVVVVRNGKEVTPAEQASKFPLNANITVKLGDHIAIQGFGLDATVLGQLDVRESPGVPTSGSGTLSVSGTYKAYGQDLTIKDGRLLFAGSPLDNPRLSIVAMREISSDQSTGLRVAGTAQQPIVTVISDPDIGEADALSYLVTGKSLNEVGTAKGGSQDALASASRSLEGAGAGLVAKRIGKRLGLDEAGVEENEMIGGSALTIGEYLSPRLYLSYGVGLFEPGEVISLRYKLSNAVGVKVQRGTEETRAGIEYRFEK